LATDVALMASYFTISGDVFPLGPSEVSPWDFRARVAAASEAGFKGVGLAHADAMAVSTRLGLPAMRSILADYEIEYFELEFLIDWFTDGDRRIRSDAVRADLFRVAEALGARHIKVAGDLSGTAWPAELMVSSFRELCDGASEVGSLITLEFMPFTNVPDLAAGLEIVRGSGARNGGVLVDIWHMFRAHTSYSDLAEVAPSEITYVELDDATAVPVGSLWEDTIHHRRLCGLGDADVPEFIRQVKRSGYDGPYGVEILSSEHRRLDLPQAAETAFTSTMQQFAISKRH
jgi:sugar phosphate isomerase/epimerase